MSEPTALDLATRLEAETVGTPVYYLAMRTMVAVRKQAAAIAKLKAVVADTCDTDSTARASAMRVLDRKAVEGDSYGVPGLGDVVDLLVSEIARLKEATDLVVEMKAHWGACGPWVPDDSLTEDGLAIKRQFEAMLNDDRVQRSAAQECLLCGMTTDAAITQDGCAGCEIEQLRAEVKRLEELVVAQAEALGYSDRTVPLPSELLYRIAKLKGKVE